MSNELPVTLSLPSGNAVVASADGNYRYLVAREIEGADKARVLGFVLVRPEGADGGRPLKRCLDIARKLGFGTVYVAHLFARLVEDASELISEGDPIGDDADEWILALARHVTEQDGLLICAWGSAGSYLERDHAVLSLLKEAGATPYCLGTDRHGFPASIARASGEPVPYEGRLDV